MEQYWRLAVGHERCYFYAQWFDSYGPNTGADNVVKIWNPFTGVLIRNLSGHTAGNSDIAWSPDGVFLASASDDTSIRIWEVDSVSFSTSIFI
jgi:WD40 repeat protein